MKQARVKWKGSSLRAGLEALTVCTAVLWTLTTAHSADTGPRKYDTSLCAVLYVLYGIHQLVNLWMGREAVHGQSHYRMTDGSGLWCILLIPQAVLVSSAYNSTDVCFLLVTSALSLVFHIYMTSPRMFNIHTQLLDLLLVACTGLFITTILWLTGKVATLLGAILYCGLLHFLPFWFPASFTYGEITVVTQILTFMVYRITENVTMTEYHPTQILATVAFLSVCIASVLYSALNWMTSRTETVYVAYVVTAALFTLPCLWTWRNPALISYLSQKLISQSHVLLILWWLFCVVVSILLVCMYGRHGNPGTDPSAGDTGQCDKKISSGTRKYFHLTVLAVYIPGLLYNTRLLYLASVVAAGVMVMLETLRVKQTPPIGPLIHQYYHRFLDPQDSGDLILTPIYLLIGCSLPCWISAYSEGGAPLAMYAGVLSVGLGDGAASVFGSMIGRLHWPGSKKTVEGSAAAVLVQITAIHIFSIIGVPGASLSVKTIIAVVMVTILEAVTSQIDNLVLPLFMYSLLA